ncbi:MAG: hypothetical protein PHE17_05160 [Thiothrix sp.]|uniref:hypothetical protein n=1 Tax=Thiothrix sp. TaxID=1032 RepID=UPI00262C5B96|nr:hypothetical protein [Thiothrix sp.]MDD5392390.1 hypothetical protein [Thiothrix sp.]
MLMTPAGASDPPTPLLQKLGALQCAVDSQTAQKTLRELFNISPPGQEWPDEWLGQKPDAAALYAGTLDIALHTLKATAERFPDLREEAERIALQWNYCDVLEDQHFYDLLLRQKKVEKLLAADDAPLKWDGFRQWGFLEPDPAGRFVPKLLDEIRLAPSAYHLFLHKAYRQRCFPHPETGLLVTEAESYREAPLGRDFSSTALSVQQAVPYPFTWNPACKVTKSVLPAKPAPIQAVVKTASKSLKKQAAAPHHVPVPLPPVVAVAEVAAVAAPPVAHKEETPALQKSLVRTEPLDRPEAGQVILPTIAMTSPAGDIPVFFEEEIPVTQAHGTTGILDSEPKKLRLAGSIADTFSLQDGGNSLSASATWSPKKNWFINGNLSLKDGKPAYAWSAGYSDWRPGTVSAQIGNTGPIAPGKGLDLEHTNASVGYKFKSDALKKHKLAAAVGLNAPLKGKPSANASLQWNPKPNWYARTTVSQPLEGGKSTWSYGFGYSDPHPGKWRVEYSNYGANKAPGDNFGKGAVTVSRGWQF